MSDNNYSSSGHRKRRGGGCLVSSKIRGGAFIMIVSVPTGESSMRGFDVESFFRGEVSVESTICKTGVVSVKSVS